MAIAYIAKYNVEVDHEIRQKVVKTEREYFDVRYKPSEKTLGSTIFISSSIYDF